MEPIDLNQLPLWLIILILLVVIGVLVYAVVSGRGIRFWGFQIEARSSLTGASALKPAPSPLEGAKLPGEASNVPNMADSTAVASTRADYDLRKIRLKIGQPKTIYPGQEDTLVLRAIEEREHTTVYARGEKGEFALIEFRKCGVVQPGVGVHKEKGDGYWLPYFTVGEMDSHCVFAFSMHYRMTYAKAAFFWIEHINKHDSEVHLWVATFKARDV